MTMKIYPIGYSTPGAFEYLHSLVAGDPALYIMDTRQTPWSPNPRWTRGALAKRYGCEVYHHIGTLLGNENHRIPGAPIKLIDPERGIAALCKYLQEGHNLVLLCTCKEFAGCHNKDVVDRLLERMPDVEVIFQLGGTQQPVQPVLPGSIMQQPLF